MTSRCVATARARNASQRIAIDGRARDEDGGAAPGVDDEDDARRPAGQAHGQDTTLLGVGAWAHALALATGDDAATSLAFAPRAPAPLLPHGQGPFAEALAPHRVVARAAPLDAAAWGVVSADSGERGASARCDAGTTSVARYVSSAARGVCLFFFRPRGAIAASR